MTNQKDDPLIAEIEKMIIDNDNELYSRKSKSIQNPGDHDAWWLYHISIARSEVLDKIGILVRKDRARQQAEKEKMIAELEAQKHPMAIGMAARYMDKGIEIAQRIIQGKEQKEEMEVSK